jgi:hypothetical protein
VKNKNLGASIRARLLNKAKSEGVDFQLLLTRYALERLLYRLSISTEKEHFLLKGALLFDLWYDLPLRPTRDIDLLGFGLAEIPHLLTVFKDICELKVDDGITFDSATAMVYPYRDKKKPQKSPCRAISNTAENPKDAAKPHSGAIQHHSPHKLPNRNNP